MPPGALVSLTMSEKTVNVSRTGVASRITVRSAQAPGRLRPSTVRSSTSSTASAAQTPPSRPIFGTSGIDLPGKASCQRIISIRPKPKSRKNSAVKAYWMPITLWSWEKTYFRQNDSSWCSGCCSPTGGFFSGTLMRGSLQGCGLSQPAARRARSPRRAPPTGLPPGRYRTDPHRRDGRKPRNSRGRSRLRGVEPQRLAESTTWQTGPQETARRRRRHPGEHGLDARRPALPAPYSVGSRR